MAKRGKMFEKVNAKEFCEKEQVLEDNIHTHIADYLTKNLIGFFQTVENSNRHKGWYAAVQQKKLKQRGGKTGFPDIVIWYMTDDFEPGWRNAKHTLCLEVKVPGKDARPEQKEIHQLLLKEGCRTFVVHSVKEVEEVLKSQGVPLKNA